MDLFTYLMAKNNQNTHRDLFSYLLGKSAGGGGTYTTFTGISLNISNTVFGKIKNFMLNSTQLTQDGTPTPSSPVPIHVITGSNNIKISNSDDIEEQNYPISLSSKNLFNISYSNSYGFTYTYNEGVYTLTPTVTNPSITFIFNNPIPAGTYYYSGAHSTLISFRNQNNVQATSLSNTDGVVTFSEPIYYIRYNYIATVGENIILDFNQTQLEKGEEKTTYEPYYNIEYCKIGDYADQIFKNTTNSPYYDNTLIENEWYLKKNINKTVITEDNKTIFTSFSESYGHPKVSILKSTINCIQNYETNIVKINKYKEVASTSSVNTGCFANNFSKYSTIFFNDTFESLEDAQNKMVGTIIYNPLATPSYIHISQEDYPTLKGQLDNLYNNAESYNGQTNITQTNDDLPFNISVDVKVANL